MTDGHGMLRGFLECPVPTYQAKLADWLAGEFWLAADQPFSEAEYTTACWLARSSSAVASRYCIIGQGDKSSYLDLGCSDALIRYLSEFDLSPSLAGTGAEQVAGALAQLRAAFCQLALVPDAHHTVARLATSVHLLDQPEPEYDTSHSSPDLPFTIFVSVPPASAAASQLRLAEAMLHESLHLFLSLIEQNVDLVRPDCRQLRCYSPWQRAERPLGGVLHGIYVFRGVHDFLRSLDTVAMKSADRHHVAARLQQICRELGSLCGFHRTKGITALGAGFLEALLDLPTA